MIFTLLKRIMKWQRIAGSEQVYDCVMAEKKDLTR